MDDVETRSKDILYTSRTAHHIGHVSQRHNLQRAIGHILSKVPDALKNDAVIKELKAFASDAKFDIVHTVYDAPEYEIKSKDCEFSKSSIRDRAEHGYNDMQRALEKSPWAGESPSHVGSTVHKFISGAHVSS
jgi:NTE family protein